MNVGILYPRSAAHPGIGIDFIGGIKSCLAMNGMTNNIIFFSENIGFGGSEKEVYSKAEKLLLFDNIDVLVAFIDLKVVAMLEPLLHACGKLMMVINAGANYPQNWIAQPNIIYLTLNHAFLCWLTGGLANNNALMATSFYDCGYLHGAAMVKHFTKNGGNITYNYINKQPYDHSFDINELSGFLAADHSTQNFLCIFDSLPASLFYEQLNKLEHASDLQLFVSPMMLENNAINKLSDNNYPFTIKGYLPWLPSLTTETNQRFIDFYQQQTKRQADIFALLGWEAGLVLQAIFKYANSTYDDGEAIANHLSTIKINSPRGKLLLDKETHYFLVAPFKCTIKNNAFEIEPESLENINKQWETFTNEPNEGVSSGWTNTYLCY